MNFRPQSARFKTVFCILLIAARCCAGAAPGNEAAHSAVDASWRALVEPLFMRPPVSVPVPNADHTVFAAGALRDGEIEYLKPGDLHGLDWKQFLEKVRPAASAELAKLKPEYRRDEHNVIQCAVLQSDRQTTAGAIFAPEFLAKFSDIFGPKLYVAIPNRFTIYVFPALASKYQDYADEVVAAYHDSVYPVSREVFELSSSGIHAVGTYQEPYDVD